MNYPKNKVLVGITPQMNGKRLIDYADRISKDVDGELHILHIEKGGDIFDRNETAPLLQVLFTYGSKYGGVVHAICGKNIYAAFKKFVKDERVTHIVLGEAMPDSLKGLASKGMRDKLLNVFPDTNFYVVKREDDGQ